MGVSVRAKAGRCTKETLLVTSPLNIWLALLPTILCFQLPICQWHCSFYIPTSNHVKTTMKSLFTHLPIALASTLFTTIIANPLDRRQTGDSIPCDQCLQGTQILEMEIPVWYRNRVMRRVSQARGTTLLARSILRLRSLPQKSCADPRDCLGMGLWGIFPHISSPTLPDDGEDASTNCFTSPSPELSTIGEECTFDPQTVNPAIVGYLPNVGSAAVDRGRVEVSFTDDGASSGATSSEASITVNVYSPWTDGQFGYPLIGSLPALGFTYGPPGSTQSYSVLTTLPYPMTCTVTVPPTPQAYANLYPLSFDFTYSDQTFSLDYVTNGTQGTAFFNVTDPPQGSWWDTLISTPHMVVQKGDVAVLEL